MDNAESRLRMFEVRIRHYDAEIEEKERGRRTPWRLSFLAAILIPTASLLKYIHFIELKSMLIPAVYDLDPCSPFIILSIEESAS